MSKALYLTRAAVMGLALGALASCTAVYRNHGYVPSKTDLAAIKVGHDTRADVREKIGDPTTEGMLKPAAWYYVASRWRYYGIYAPKEIRRQVIAISFNDKGVVSNVERFGLKDGHVVVLTRRVTTANTAGTTLLRQLLGSVGRLSSDQLVK